MSTVERATGRYLGRPESVPPGYVPGTSAGSFDAARAADRSGVLWLVKAVSGGLLVIFLGVHLVAQHLLVPEGLRDFASVVDYLRQPLALAIETLLVGTVLVHAAVALRTFAGELVRSPRWLRAVSYAIILLALATFGYTVWLTISVVSWTA
jgi:succinate dehydrogenase hydrophobic anchor subunit